VFADPEDNKKFLRIVEESRRKHGDSFEAYIYQSGIASWLHTFTPDGRLPHQPDRVRQSIRANFQMRSLETRMAFRIISLHPGTYVRGVLQRYLLLFNPFKGYELFRPPFTDPQDIYPWVSVILSPDIEQAFYPPDGTVHAGPRDGIFLSVFPGTFVLPVIRPFFTRHLFTPAAFIHIFFALAFSAAYVVRKKRPAMFRVSVFASLFFLNAVLQYILIAIVHEPYERYAMMGELSLNAAGVLCVFALFVDRFRPTPSLSVQRSASTSLPPPSRTVVVR
jgi:hypothetical protein